MVPIFFLQQCKGVHARKVVGIDTKSWIPPEQRAIATSKPGHRHHNAAAHRQCTAHCWGTVAPCTTPHCLCYTRRDGGEIRKIKKFLYQQWPKSNFPQVNSMYCHNIVKGRVKGRGGDPARSPPAPSIAVANRSDVQLATCCSHLHHETF